MNTDITYTTLRRWLPALGIITSLFISSFSVAYVTLAAPRQEVFVPTTVGFEGRLADSSGSPVADGNHNITFSLYSQATGGDPVWTEVQPNVTTHSGLYSVQLGSVDPTNNSLQPSDFDGPRWLGVKVGTEAEMAPRIPISSVPFALNAQEAAHAEDADALQGHAVSANTPTAGQALLWDESGSEWLPGTVATPGASLVPSARVYNNANVLIPTGAWTMIPFNAERWDNDAIHSLTTNTTRLTVQTPGRYLIIGQASLLATAVNFHTGILLNGTNYLAVVLDYSANSGAYGALEVSTVYDLQAGDYVELGVFHSTGSGIYVRSSSDWSPEFTLIKMSD